MGDNNYCLTCKLHTVLQQKKQVDPNQCHCSGLPCNCTKTVSILGCAE